MKFAFRPLTRAFVAESLSWRYEPPYDIYNVYVTPSQAAAAVATYFTGESEFRQIELDGVPIALVSFGLDGQVNGGDYSDDALDIGLGVAPEMTSKGFGTEIVQAIVDYAVRGMSPRALRVTIAAFNTRAQRVWQKNGFREVSRFVASGSGMKFIVYMREVT